MTRTWTDVGDQLLQSSRIVRPRAHAGLSRRGPASVWGGARHHL